MKRVPGIGGKLRARVWRLVPALRVPTPRVPALRIPAPRVLERAGSLRRSPLVVGLGALVLMAGLLAGLTYYSAGEFNKRAADTRASNEASSFAEHSGTLATGEAFAGYIQLLRDADDPVVRTKTAAQQERVAALQQLLYLNVNRFESLSIADRSGLVLATTDAGIVSVRDSATFAATRGSLSPANSDVILPAAARHGYVEFATALREADGTNWGFLVARADPARLWSATLLASVDGSRNVIINNAGQFAAGVPDELLGRPWKGSAVGTQGVRAKIDGVDSICGLAAIGKDTQIDRGLDVASCLPVSVIQAEHGQAMGKQGLVTAAGAVLAVVLAAGLMTLALRQAPPSAGAAKPKPTRQDDNANDETLAASDDGATEAPEAPGAPAAAPTADIVPDGDDNPLLAAITAAPPDAAAVHVEQAAEPLPPLDIDAVALIDAFEHRSARLAERLRESVQTKLMVAATKADEAYKLAGSDEELSASLHGHAMEELERLRERDLRAIGQELYPGLTRLGLPSALRGLAKDLADVIEITLDVDASADALSAGAGRTPIATPLRLMLYRAVQEAARAFALAGASTCTVSLRREGAHLALEVGATAPAELDRSLLAASTISIEARAGHTTIADEAGTTTVSIRVPASAAPDDALDAAAAAADDSAAEDHDAAGGGSPSAPTRARTNIAEVVRRIAREHGGSMEVEVQAPDDAPELPAALQKTLLGLTEASLKGMAVAGATRCAVTLSLSDSVWKLAIASDGDGREFDAASLSEWEFGLEAFEGGSAVERGTAYIHVGAQARVPDALAPAEAPTPEASSPVELATTTDDAPAAESAIADGAPRTGLAGEIQRLEREYAGRVELDTYAPDDEPELPAPLHKTLLGLLETSLTSMAAVGASRCEVMLSATDGVWKLVLISDGDGSAFDAPALGEYEFGLEAFEGGSSVDRRPGHIRVAAEARVPGAGGAAAEADAA